MILIDSTNIQSCSIRDGHLSILTPGCGCCSEYYTNDPDSYSSDWSISLFELKEYIKKEEERLTQLRAFVESSNKVVIQHISD